MVWRKQDGGKVPKDAERALAKIAGDVAVTPERLRIPWQPYPSTADERIWEWTVVVADPAPAPRGRGVSPEPACQSILRKLFLVIGR